MKKLFARWRPGVAAVLALAAISLAPFAFAQSARFDLAGPSIEVRVTRGTRTLPIAYVPNLQPGDKIWLHPNLPPTQSIHYLLIAAFLRGTTNPPPDNWFTRIETWNPKVREEGISVTVPEEAEQAILFLAPSTGGDFSTLKKAVRDRPGVFVRASQDLAQAGFEQSRIEKYLASMREVPPSDPKAMLNHSTLLARTLNLKPNDDCFKLPVDMQYTCLTQSGNQTLLDDSHAQDVLAMLSNGPNSDFITQTSTTSMVAGGNYSAYVGAAVDLFRILGGLHTAQYQYIPAISFPEQASLNLRLNTAPSFRNPKSVIVIGLPAITKAVPPPLRPADANFVTCLLKPKVVLPIDGAPLVFSTSFAHDLALHLNVPGSTKEIPLIPDAYRGGLVVDHTPERKPLPVPTEAEITAPDPKHDTSTPLPTLTPKPAGDITGTITGTWGFDSFTGPTVPLQSIPGKDWKLAATNPLIAGRDGEVTLSSTGTACVESVRLETSPGQFETTQWKHASRPNLVDVTLPLKSSHPGDLQIAIRQFGAAEPSLLTTKAFSEPATLTAINLHVGDTTATATGTNLDQVRQITLADLTFTPAPDSDLNSSSKPETLLVTLPFATPAPKLHAGDKLTANIALRDGRTLVLPVTVAPGRPVVTILSRNMGRPIDPDLHLGSDDDLPASQQITFSLKSPTPFPRTGEIEIANADESLHATLTVAAGTLVLQNPHTILATFDPLKSFGTSAYGQLRLRAISPDGIDGDWLPLATLVRLPSLTDLRCTPDPTATCTLDGSKLYLLDAIATDSAFTTPTPVPDGFVASTLSIPRPTDLPATLPTSHPVTATLYLRLRDDPSTINTIILPAIAQSVTTASTQPTANKDAQP
jgi:hypothetical protein